MTASYSPTVHWKFWTQTGTPVPAAGYLLWFYAAGTTTPQAAYTDTTGSVAAPNPVILDTNGECNFCLSDSVAYKILLTDAANGNSTPGNTQSGWPLDNVQSGTLAALTAIEALLLNTSVVTDGAGMISFYPALSYPANTVGNSLKGAASSAGIQAQSYTYFTSSWAVAGIPNYVLTPSPALTTYTIGQRFHLHAHASGVTGYNYLNINTLGNWPIVQYDQFGNQIPAPIVVGQNYDIEYIGSAFQVLNPVVPTGMNIKGDPKNLLITYNGTSLSGVLQNLDEVLVKNSNGDGQVLRNVASLSSPLNFSLGSNGAGGLDNGTALAYQVYYLYVIWAPCTSASNGTPQVALLASLKGDLPGTGPVWDGSPLLPAFYTHWARIGAFCTDSSAYPFSGRQIGRNFWFLNAGDLSTGYPVVLGGASGSPTTPTYSSLSIGGTLPFTGGLPVTIASVEVVMHGNTNSDQTLLAPYTGTPPGLASSTTNPPPMVVYGGYSCLRGRIPNLLMLQQNNLPVYYASADANAIVQLLGWEDNL